jgi:hypothetical protein
MDESRKDRMIEDLRVIKPGPRLEWSFYMTPRVADAANESIAECARLRRGDFRLVNCGITASMSQFFKLDLDTKAFIAEARCAFHVMSFRLCSSRAWR